MISADKEVVVNESNCTLPKSLRITCLLLSSPSPDCVQHIVQTPVQLIMPFDNVLPPLLGDVNLAPMAIPHRPFAHYLASLKPKSGRRLVRYQQPFHVGLQPSPTTELLGDALGKESRSNIGIRGNLSYAFSIKPPVLGPEREQVAFRRR